MSLAGTVLAVWLALASLLILAGAAMVYRLLHNIAQQAAYDADMYAQVKRVIDDLISISPEKTESLEVAKLEIEEAERTARVRASRDHLTAMFKPNGDRRDGGEHSG